MYPFKFNPILKSTIWGGEKIIPFKGLDIDQPQVGESWEISNVPGDESVVSYGADAGKNLSELVKEYKGAWFGAAFICLINAISMLFADELFRWHLSFRVWNADHLEPSDWELAGRYISWTVLCVMALVLFIVGLQ